ncbi:BTB/POZ domain-containing protein At5g47800 isoform X2 [Ananas comosus]|uniref:BTB/POZ domain-containing protein At5g47800 isoform X2 n=1 Tax=Ananas comosus TaxID=4615 RepID=A0A6P5G172_ANACO|nr:BTB/POZ domain-containing protein At5g47800 isoform X2 [Ananas comosus]
MKYMKLGTKPDIFYTEEAVRSVLSDVPTDLIIHINNTKYLLHKCGLLQRLCSDTDDEGSHPIPIALHEIPGGEEAFELCAKFCYGIAINVSAHNFVQAISSARFLRMTESVAKGNLVMKLESFFDSCILQGWKDTITTLEAAWKLSGWSENRIVQPCMDSIVEKILIHPSKVTWSYTYTRPGYNKKQHPSVPKDWWTEDVAELDLDLFRSIISTVRSTKTIPPPLIGEALHVYTCKHLPDPLEAHSSTQSSASRAEETLAKQRRILESIVGMIPGEPGSVSCRFLLRLLKVANYAGASASTKAELIRRAGRQLDEAEPTDLLIPLPSDPQSYDVGAAEAVLENFLAQFRRPMAPEENRRLNEAMEKVAKTFDSYLQVVAGVPDLPLAKFIDLVESLPEIARKDHDGIYQAIDTYLKEHSELGKEEKKSLCRMIDCRKLSPEIRAQAVTNDRMPLRTIVQLLFLEHERSGRASGSQGSPLDRTSVDILSTRIAKQESRKAERGSEGHRPRGEPTEHERTASVGMTRSLSVSKQVNEEIADDKSGGMGRKSKTK